MSSRSPSPDRTASALLTIVVAVNPMHPDTATRVRRQAIESVVVLYIVEDGAQDFGIDDAEHAGSLDKR